MGKRGADFFDCTQDPRTVAVPRRPDKPQESPCFPIKSFDAAIGKVGSVAPPKIPTAQNHPPQPQPDRQVKPDHQIRTCRTGSEGGGYPALYDPSVPSLGPGDHRDPLDGVTRNPIRLPVNLIKVHDGKTGSCPNPARQSRFARPRSTNDHDPLHHPSPAITCPNAKGRATTARPCKPVQKQDLT